MLTEPMTGLHCRLSSCIIDVGPNYVELERPLPYDIRPEYKPSIRSAKTYRRILCGVESLSIRFPWSAFPGVNKEKGYNALSLANVQHSWVKDVEIVNADLGVVLWDVTHFSVMRVTLTTSKPRYCWGRC